MSAAAAVTVAIFATALIAIAFGPDVVAFVRRRRARLRGAGAPKPEALGVRDPGRELRAERRAEQLLRSVLGEPDYEAYRALGFLHLAGSVEDADGRPSYGYLIYAHKPIVSYDMASGALLSEHCVTFPDRSEAASSEFGQRLPDADDVLAKWMALRGDERGLIGAANMHLPGRQHDPEHLRRDLVRLSEWSGRTASQSTEPAEGGAGAL